jgi:hypothetical protein
MLVASTALVAFFAPADKVIPLVTRFMHSCLTLYWNVFCGFFRDNLLIFFRHVSLVEIYEVKIVAEE